MQFRKLLPALVVAAMLPACASLPPGTERDSRDRFERFNRSVYIVNDKLDRAVAKPVAKAYVKVTPAPVRTGIGNFFKNLAYTRVIINDLLQGKGGQFFSDTARLLVNTTIGIGGLFDPAGQMGLAAHDEDFGQTLGKWGVPPGPFLMLPLLGPSTVRDGFGLVADRYSEPDTYLVHDWKVQAGLVVGSLVDTRASLLSTDDLLSGSFDPYAFMRNAYLQRREFQVTDGESSGADDFEIFEDEEPAEPPADTSADQADDAAQVDVPPAQDDADTPATQDTTQ
jgi:phospholipid-binding lipoprotein MlaA